MSKSAELKKDGASWTAFLSSTRLAIYLLIVLAIACAAGVFLPQKGITLEPGEYTRLIQQPSWAILDRFGFLSIFRSVWFLALVFLMMVNLVLCSIKGVGRVGRRIQAVRRPLTLKGVRKRGYFRIWNGHGEFESTVFQALTGLGRVKKETEPGKIFLRVEKGALALYAPFLVHLSIILMVLGALVDVFTGIDARMNLPEGETSDVITSFSTDGTIARYKLPFTLRCDDFNVEMYPGTNQPKDYRSDLVVVEKGTDAFAKTIEVNDPLTWGGFRIFQSSYGQMDSRISLQIVRRSDGRKELAEAKVKEAIRLETFIDSFSPLDVSPTNKGAPTTPGMTGFSVLDVHPDLQGHGLAARIAVLRLDAQPEPFWVFAEAPDFDDQRNGPYRFVLLGMKEHYFTGLMVVRKPGAAWIWAGSSLFLAAICFGFFVPFRRAWVRIDGQTVMLAGASNRLPESWREKLETVAGEIEKSLGPPSEGSGVDDAGNG